MKDTAELRLIEQEEVQTDLRELFRGAVKMTLESVLEEVVVELCGAPKGARGARKDVRNGSYLRQLLTSQGHIEVAVPRTRSSGSAADVLGRYKRRTDDIDETIAEAYVHGVSTRDMSSLTKALAGEEVSSSTVSRITKRLEENVEALRQTPIEEPMPYLFLDATFLHARWARTVENVAALVAYGVGEGGKRQLLAITVGPQESEDSWSELLRQLLERGLDGVRLVIADEHAGLAAAVRKLLPEAERQRCTVHLMRNVCQKSPARHRQRMGRQLAKLFQAGSLKEAKKLLADFKRTWSKQLPEAVSCLERGFVDATRYFSYPKRHWKRIRSTNGLERLHGEIKRRIRAVRAFPDRASALRLITAVALHATSKWDDRRYLDMSLLETEAKELAQAA
jgi:transposase-like protein